ncbi:MAG: hypothetical protein IJP86_04390 [Synergistaceae bacterium]|nr:hypothetical protein [Synergistaceae bacterium]
MAVKKALELDAKVKQIIDEEFSDFEKYLPTLQDVRMYQRKRNEYWEKVSARIKESNENNGRTDDTAANG